MSWILMANLFDYKVWIWAIAKVMTDIRENEFAKRRVDVKKPYMGKRDSSSEKSR